MATLKMNFVSTGRRNFHKSFPMFHEENEPSKKGSRPTSTLANMLVNFYNVGAYSLLTPFALKCSNSDTHDGNEYKLSRHWKIIQTVVLMTHVSAVVYRLYMILLSPVQYNATNLMAHILSLMSLTLVAHVTTIIHHLWTRQGALVHFMNKMDQIHQSLANLNLGQPKESQTCRKMAKIWSGAIILFWISWSILDTLDDYQFLKFGVYEGFRRLTLNLPGWFYLTEAPTVQVGPNLGMSDPFMWKARNDSMGQVPMTHLALTCLAMYLHTFKVFLAHWGDLVCLLHALCLYSVLSSFVHQLKVMISRSSSDEDFVTHSQFHGVVEIVEELCEVSEVMDESLGSLIFCSCFGLLPFYAWKLLAVVRFGDFHGLEFFVYSLVLGSTLFLAAEANSKSGYLVKWLRLVESRLGLRGTEARLEFHSRVTLILAQIGQNEIGLGGKFFVITHPFVGSITGIILTYAIILLQLESLQ